jgi:phosphoribosyl-ATP pyrophosphohydrolase
MGKDFTLNDLAKLIKARSTETRRSVAGSSSYTVMLLQKGREHIGRKVVEEAVEVFAEVVRGLHGTRRRKSKLIGELGDLLYHTLVLAASQGISLHDIEKHLGEKHRNLSASQSKKPEAVDLRPYIVSSPRFDLQNLLARYHMSLPISADVVLLSHHLRQRRLPDAQRVCRFSNDAKALQVRLSGGNLKAKVAVPRGNRGMFDSRREPSLVLPVVVVLSSVVLPLCVNILAAYIKDWIDAHYGENARRRTIEVDIAVRESKKRKEKWYSIKGKPQEVCRTLRRLGRGDT